MRSFRHSGARIVLGLCSVALLAPSATACAGGDSTDAQRDDAVGTNAAAPVASPSNQAAAPPQRDSSTTGGTDATGKPPTGAAKRTGTSAGGRGARQVCGDNDLTFSVTTRTRAAGYFLVKATANPGVTCALPETPPVVTFGSKARAAPAEQAVGPRITLGDGSSAYAGINPKTTANEHRTEFDSFHLSLTSGSGAGVQLTPKGGVSEDGPTVTNWHTTESAAAPTPVPGDGSADRSGHRN
ncbi:DUF4232 domain-containing protein [Embleya sp. AB8]|uniref:DUF4232 domain-containing protein n=1 Tax=Embleya sp. AB8 TaxID=3156304 RepID=UPI003C75494F